MFIDTFKTTADRIAFEDRGKGITSPDVQSAIEEVFEKAVGSGGNGGNGGDDNVIVWVSKVSYDKTLSQHENMNGWSTFEIDIDTRFNRDNIDKYEHFLVRGPYLYNSETRLTNNIDAEAMLTGVLLWDKLMIEYYSDEDPIMLHVRYSNLSGKTLYTKKGDSVVVVSVKDVNLVPEL